MTGRRRRGRLGWRTLLLAEHVIEGPSALYPPGLGPPGLPWLECFLSLQMGEFSGNVERRQLFEMPQFLKGTEGYRVSDYVYPVLRRTVWSREEDHKRALKRPVRRPSVVTELFELPRRRLDELNQEILAFDRGLPSFPSSPTGISNEPRDLPGLPSPEAPSLIDKQLAIRRVLENSVVELSGWYFESGLYTDAFARLWGYLGLFCARRYSAREGWREAWRMTPRTYALGLDVALTPNVAVPPQYAKTEG